MKKKASAPDKPGMKKGKRMSGPASSVKESGPERVLRLDPDLHERALWKKRRRAYWSSRFTKVLSEEPLRKAKAKKS
jgi:hypothetical protein